MEARYKIQIEAYQKRRDSLGRAFQAEVQEYQAKEKTYSTKKKQELGQQLGQKQQRLQQQLQFEEQQISKSSQTEIDSLIAKVTKFVKDYGQKNGYTFILGTSENNASVMYGKEDLDITDVISKAINASYKSETSTELSPEKTTDEATTEAVKKE